MREGRFCENACPHIGVWMLRPDAVFANNFVGLSISVKCYNGSGW